MQTTDNQDEIFPVVDENDNVIGKTTRREANTNPKIIHRAVAILIYNPEGKLLLQKRSLTKDTSPGCWTMSASGHVEYGDDYLPTAIREMDEEVGIKLKPEELENLGKLLVRAPWESEYFHIYRYNSPHELKLIAHPDEVAELRFFSMEELKKALTNKDYCWAPIAQAVFKEILFKD